MNIERGGPGDRLRTKRVSTLKSATFWYHREMAEGAMGGGCTCKAKFIGGYLKDVKRIAKADGRGGRSAKDQPMKRL
jgi:hypothetical protein